LAPTRALVMDADVVLAIGTELAETDYDITFTDSFKIPGTLLRIDIDPDQTVRNFPPAVALVSDADIAVNALLTELVGQHRQERAEDWGRTRAAALRETLEASWDGATRGQTRF